MAISTTPTKPATTGPQRKRPRRVVLGTRAVAVAVVGLLGLAIFAIVRPGPSESGDLFFTTFSHTALYKVPFSFKGGSALFDQQTLIANLPAADGVIFEPNGKLLVGGQNTGDVLEVDPSSGAVTKQPSGCPGSFLLALSPDGNSVYTAGDPGPLCVLPVDPLAPGKAVALSGSDTSVTSLAFVPGGPAFYASSPPSGIGSFGTFDPATGTTTRLISQVTAHGMAYDPFTKTLYVFGGDTILQFDPYRPQTPLSQMTVPNTQFDTGTVDGHGHLYVASNNGQLVVVDDHVSQRLNDTRNVVTQVRLTSDLDDIAPLEGPGSFVQPGIAWAGWAVTGLVLLLVAGLVLLFWPHIVRHLSWLGARLKPTSALPSWDLRRREEERIKRRREATRRRRPPPKR